MIKAKKTLIFLVTLFVVLITAYTTIRFRTVKHFTQVYTYPEWKLNENNSLRIAFLEFLNRKSFLPFYLELYITDSKGNKTLLDKGRERALLYNKDFKISDLAIGKGFLNGIIKFDDDIVDNFNIPIKIIDKFSDFKVELAPRVVVEIDPDFKEDDKLTTYPRFNESSKYVSGKSNIMIQIFGAPKDFVFSEKNKIFLLFTYPDYTPVKSKININIGDFFSKGKKLSVETDENGLIYFEEKIFRSGGYIYMKSDLLGNRKVVFSLSDDKTAIFTDKNIYKQGETIKLNIKTYKKINELYFNIIIGNSWIKSQHIKITKKDNLIEFTPPEDYTGFIEFNVYRGYSYLKDSSYKKIFIGSKNSLKNEFLKLKNDFINRVINNNTDNSAFYSLIMSQLDGNKPGINKVFDSYKSQQEKLDKDRDKYLSITWYLLLFVSGLIVFIIFFTSYKTIKDSYESIEFQYRQKGGVIYLYIFISILIAFMTLILWVLRIV